jgi:hypothetical protein
VLLYYAMSNVCRIVQQDLMYRFDPKVKSLVAQEVREVEALTHEIDEREARDGKGPAKSTGARPTTGRNPGPAPTGNATPGGSRFRNLLSAATEQQRQTPGPAKALGPADATKGPAGPKARPPTTNGNGSNGKTTNKNPASNGKPPAPGQGRAAKTPPSKSTHRTNRKRRGR